ncbi:MAG TPA: hypothetical protein VGW80_09945 [Solirubrobacterales bacterium]|nr:hypothetical protein [Solirubrobacterales bacterium]
MLDPRLSLIGACQQEELDTVEDPGCPEKHPPAPFAFPRGVATDAYGDIYVSNHGKKLDGSEGRIDIFGPDGVFIFEIPNGVVASPQSLAVDNIGTLYVWAEEAGKLFRFDPCKYDPAAGDIEYCNPPVVVPLDGPDCVFACPKGGSLGYTQMAVDPDNEHLFINFGGVVAEYKSAEEGNEEIRSLAIRSSGTAFGGGLALDSERNRLYVQEAKEIGIYEVVEGLPPQEEYDRIGIIDGSTVPQEHFGGYLSLAVDEGTGHLYVYDTEFTHLWELDEDGAYIATVEFPFETVTGTEIAIDNGLLSPNGKLSEEEGKGRYLYVPSHPKKTPGHLFAFFVSKTSAPDVKSVAAANVSVDEAELQALINPGNLTTTYVFEVKADGAADWTKVGEGTLAGGNLDAEGSAAAKGLSPGTHYSFRVIATNEKGSDEAEGSFSTYPSLPAEPSPCSNALLRTGLSALLPDCRAYELVTPPDTNARAPLGANGEGGGGTTRQVSPAGDKVPFRVEGGSLPGLGGTGSLVGDPYLATRTASGWSTAYTGPSGAEAVSSGPGTTSPDQGYSFWGAAVEGSAVVEGKATFYVRYPDGHSELLGQGALGIDPESTGRLISEGGTHIIFTTGSRASSATAVQLEPDAAPDGTSAIYDRTPDGITHVVSLKPGGASFEAGEQALFDGASGDGVGVAFEVNGVLYLRYNNEETFEIAEGVEFAGVAEGGRRVFYLQAGNLMAFDVATKEAILFANTIAKVVPVTISDDGSVAYFVSTSVVSKSGPNPAGAQPQPGAQNLYRSQEGQISFVGTVTERDVTGSSAPTGDGLGLWVDALTPPPAALGWIPARSTPDGRVFLFKSRAPLTGYNPEGHAEIYRYDSAANQLQCLSCNPTGAPARSDSTLQSESREGSELATALVWPENLRADGRRAFFESSEPLVAGDVDGLQDIYEWEDQGVGSCTQAGGCLFLISSPQSSRSEYLWAVSRSGDDVFFLSSDLLVGADADETPSIYDARVGGGFAEPAGGECEGEGCRPNLSPPPPVSNGDTPVRGSGDNVKPRKCPKGKRKVKRNGKVRCVKKRHRKHAKHRHHRAGTGQKGARR